EWRNHAKYRGGNTRGKRVISLCHAARYLDINDAVLQPRALKHIGDQLLPVSARFIDRDLDGRQTALKPCQVFVHAKRTTGIGRHNIVDAVAKNETSVEHGNASITQPHVLTVQINNTVVIHTSNHGAPFRKNGTSGARGTPPARHTARLFEHQADFIKQAAEQARLGDIAEHMQVVFTQDLTIQRQGDRAYARPFGSWSQQRLCILGNRLNLGAFATGDGYPRGLKTTQAHCFDLPLPYTCIDDGFLVIKQLDRVEVLKAPIKQLQAELAACRVTAGTQHHGNDTTPVAQCRGNQAVPRRLGVTGFQAVHRGIRPEQTVSVVLLDVVVGVFLLAVIVQILREGFNQVF